MGAFGNESTLNFLRQYQGEDIQVFDNKYQPHKGKSVKILYDPDKGAEAIRRGLKMLEEGKRVAFSVTACKKARAIAIQASKLLKPDGSHVLSRVYFGQMDGKQRQEDFADINATWSALDCVVYTSTVEAGVSFEISNHFDAVIGISNINTGVHTEAFAQMFYQDKIADCYIIDLSPAVETYFEVEYQKHLSAKYFPEILCSLIASTGATLELISAEDTEKVNRNVVSHTIKNVGKKIEGADAESIASAPDISNIGGKDDIQNWGMNNDDWVKLCDINFVKRYNNPEPLQYFRRLAYFRRQGSNATNSIENLKIKEEMQWEDSHNSMDLSSVDLHKFHSVKQWKSVHNLIQSIGFRDIDDTNILSGDDVAKTFEQSWEKIVKIREDALLLFNFKTRAKGIPDLNATIKFINAILEGPKDQRIWKSTYWIHRVPPSGAEFETIERIMAIKLNDPNYHPTVPILPPYKPESVNETQELFDSIPITTDIAISEKAKFDALPEKSDTNLLQLSSSVSIQNQSNDSKEFSNITKTKIEIPEPLVSLSSEFLIKNESDIDTLIILLQQKFQMSKEKLEPRLLLKCEITKITGKKSVRV
ncbi:12197_t:CDS:2 [Entrophospora sp. SA101]|nr:12197_t:CDS:2 [Entrophospora sp. SA101]